jgi:hypothetical protein
VTSVLRPDGTRRWESDPKRTGNPVWFVEKNNDTGKATIGLDVAPAAGFEVVEVFDRTARTRIETRDMDGSGKPELRRTMRYAVDLQTVEIVNEADPMETGTFAEVSRSTEPAAWDQGGTACDGSSNIPGNAISQWWANKAPDMVPSAPGIDFFSGNGAPYDCTPDEATKLAAAFDCALTRARECLPNANQRLAEKMTADAVASQGSLHVGCNNPCAGKLATTLGSTMNVSNSVLNSYNLNDLCSVIMHEMFHRAGEPGGKDHDSTGTDSTYSCARYCANCSHTGKGAPASSNVDCARCGETDAEKRRCGVERTLVGTPCPKLDLCHGGIGVNLNCTSCKGIQEVDCDMKPFSKEPLFYCCETCPDNAPRNTDKPCMGAPSLTAGTCGNKAPECP